MAEDRKDNKQHADPTTTAPPLKQPFASHPPQSTDFSETGKLPGYVAWLQLQYQQQLETAIANMSGSGMSRCLAYPQANAQQPPQFLSSTAAPSGLEAAYLQAKTNSSFANQQWLDNRAPQIVPPTSLEIRSGQNMQHSPELPAVAAYDTSSPNTDYLMLMAQQSMVNAAGGGQDMQTTIDHDVGQAQFGGEQQLQHPPCQCASVCCALHGHALPFKSAVIVASQSLLHIVIVLLYSKHPQLCSSNKQLCSSKGCRFPAAQFRLFHTLHCGTADTGCDAQP